MLSKIGQPIDQPVITAIQLIPSSSSCFASIKRKVREIVEYELENIDKFSMDLAYGKIPIC